MKRLGVAIDIGTSGIRAQAIYLNSGEIISTAIATHHPIPGANVIDHLHFALETGIEIAQTLLINTINKVIKALNVQTEYIERVGLCGNAVQLSLFQGIEIRDLAYTGKQKLDLLGIIPPKRDAIIIKSDDIAGLNLPGKCDIIIPPAIQHEIGADALAMIIKSGILEQNETALVTDYGTNAEMAIFHMGSIVIGSTAAGPALEGQQISCGMLAVPGSISDIETVGSGYRIKVLDSKMIPVESYIVDIENGNILDEINSMQPLGITGTGTIAIIDQAIKSKLITIPRIITNDARLHFWENIYFTEQDLYEAGKAIGAIRAGHISLCTESGIDSKDISTAYLSGATGTYVDVEKAQKIGLIPSHVKTVRKLGNTSLAMAIDLVMDPECLDMMSNIANKLRKSYCMFASSEIFKKVYILEIAFWTEGMPISLYRKFLKKYGLSDLLPVVKKPDVIQTTTRDIKDLGKMGLTIIPEIDEIITAKIEGCTLCMNCVEVCPKNAITIIEKDGTAICHLNQSSCIGMSCKRCERACPEKVFYLNEIFQNKRKV